MATKLKESDDPCARTSAMQETTTKAVGDYISQLISTAAWRKSQPSTNVRETAATAAGPSIGGLKVPYASTEARAAVEISFEDRQETDASVQCYTGALAKARAPNTRMKRQFSSVIESSAQELPLNYLLNVNFPKDHSAAIKEMKSAIGQIEEPIVEDRIENFVKGSQFETWVTSNTSSALLVNNDQVNLSLGSKRVSLLTELTILLHDSLSMLPKEDPVFTLLYFCGEYPQTNGTLTTLRRMLQYLTSEHYVQDREHWDNQDFIRQYIHILKSSREDITREESPNSEAEESGYLIDLFMEMLDNARKDQVIYIMIDGLDIVEMEEAEVTKRDLWRFLEDFYHLLKDCKKAEKLLPAGLEVHYPVIKLLVTFHTSCHQHTRSYWSESVVDLGLSFSEASKTR